MENKSSVTAFTDSQLSRLVLARSLEWEALPVFATRAMAPIGLFWLTWWQLVLLLVIPSILWCPIRSRWVSFQVAMMSSYLNNALVSLLANAAIALVFFLKGRTLEGVVALLWHFISSILAFAYPPTNAPKIQAKLWAQMGMKPEC